MTSLRDRHDVARVRPFSGESCGNRYLAYLVSLAARPPRAGPGSGRLPRRQLSSLGVIQRVSASLNQRSRQRRS